MNQIWLWGIIRDSLWGEGGIEFVREAKAQRVSLVLKQRNISGPRERLSIEREVKKGGWRGIFLCSQT